MERYSFFNAVMDSNGNYDREYLAEDFAAYFASFIGNGVYASPSSNLKVLNTGSMNVEVSAGKAWIDGYFYENTEKKAFSLDILNQTAEYSRIDSIVLRLDLLNRKITTELKKGTASKNPTAPTLTHNDNVHELRLANVKVVGGRSEVKSQDITDCRFGSECGVVSGVVDQIDTDGLFSQYDDEFRTWFEEVQNTLSTDAAGNLHKQIETERKRIDTLIAQKGNEVTTETILPFVGGTYCECGTIKAISNGISAEIYLPALKWTSASYGFWQTIAELPDSLKPLTQSKSGTVVRQILFKTDIFEIGLRDDRLQVRADSGTHTYHNLMLSYSLKNPVVPELQDIRVDVDGEVHASAGDAVRSQFGEVNERFDLLKNATPKEYNFIPITENSEDLEKDRTLSATGDMEMIGKSFLEAAEVTYADGFAIFRKELKKGDSIIFSNAVNIYPSSLCNYIYLVGEDSVMDMVYALDCFQNQKKYTLKEDGIVIFSFKTQGISGVGEYFFVKESSQTEPLVLDSNVNYENDVEAGEATLKAIMEGKQIVVRVPNADGGNYTAIYSPIYQYQLPNYMNSYLYLFYLRDEKQTLDLSAMGMGQIQLPIYGQIKMKLSRDYNQTPLK